MDASRNIALKSARNISCSIFSNATLCRALNKQTHSDMQMVVIMLSAFALVGQMTCLFAYPLLWSQANSLTESDTNHGFQYTFMIGMSQDFNLEYFRQE